MSLEPEKLTLLKMLSEDDGGGGETKEQWVEAWHGTATVNLYKKLTWLREEDGKHNTQGPGIETLTRRLLTLRAGETPFPAVAINDRFRRADGSLLVVQNVRPYTLTLQIDTEIVE